MTLLPVPKRDNSAPQRAGQRHGRADAGFLAQLIGDCLGTRAMVAAGDATLVAAPTKKGAANRSALYLDKRL